MITLDSWLEKVEPSEQEWTRLVRANGELSIAPPSTAVPTFIKNKCLIMKDSVVYIEDLAKQP